MPIGGRIYQLNSANLKPVNLSRFHVNHLLLAAWILLLVILFVLAIDSIISKRPGGDSSDITSTSPKASWKGTSPTSIAGTTRALCFTSLNLFGLLIHDTWGLWLVQGVFLLGASTFAFLALRKPFGTLPALFALALFLSFFATFVPPGNFTEQYGLLFQFLTLYLFLRSHEQPNPAPPMPASLPSTSPLAPSALLLFCLDPTSSPSGSLSASTGSSSEDLHCASSPGPSSGAQPYSSPLLLSSLPSALLVRSGKPSSSTTSRTVTLRFWTD